MNVCDTQSTAMALLCWIFLVAALAAAQPAVPEHEKSPSDPQNGNGTRQSSQLHKPSNNEGHPPQPIQQPTDSAPEQAVLVVLGAAGTDEYGKLFIEWVDKWRQAAEPAAAQLVVIGRGSDPNGIPDRKQLRLAIERQAQQDIELVWLVLIGHGTYDGHVAKFNLRGPDLTAAELSEWLAPIKSPLAVINCASSSAPFINRLSGEDRVIITATKSGYELNFARFGGYLADSISNLQADLDKDDQVSLLEAYLTACRQVQEFYDQEARLATEHALLDDNGDGLGTPAAWFRGVRATQRAKEGAPLDGLRAHQLHLVPSDREQRMTRDQRKRRDALEQSIAALREEKPGLGEDEYYRQLQNLMVELAGLYQSVEKNPQP